MTTDRYKKERTFEDRLRAIKLVVTDIDGTIHTTADPMCTEALAGLDLLDAHRIPWAFATGRTWTGMRTATMGLFSQRPRARMPAALCLNGALAIPEGEVRSAFFRKKTFDANAMKRVLDVVKLLHIQTYVFLCDTEQTFPRESILALNLRKPITKENIFAQNGLRISSGTNVPQFMWNNVASFVLDGSHDLSLRDIQEWQNALSPTVVVSSSGLANLEITPFGVSKGTGLSDLASFYEIDVSAIMTIGDSYNDIEMLKAAGVSFAVANAPPAVKTSADQVLDDQAGAGVTSAIRCLLAAKGL